ncbi:MAG TPA: hypothetical protein VFQ88_09405 [Nevskiaceae bacterium]|nr:hypothetical protein [Nevskiaceae bacterium]
MTKISKNRANTTTHKWVHTPYGRVDARGGAVDELDHETVSTLAKAMTAIAKDAGKQRKAA